MNVLELQGPEFLMFYVVALGVAWVGANALRNALRKPTAEIPLKELVSLRPVEVAFLAGGFERALDSTVSALAQRKLVEVAADPQTITLTAAPPADADTIEKRVHTIFGGKPRSLEDANDIARPLFEPLREKLTHLGLLMSDETKRVMRIAPAAVIGAVLLLGLVKIMVGVSRDKPVEFLIVLSVIAAVMAVRLIATGPDRSLSGDIALKRLRARNAALELSTAVNPERVSPNDLALAVGLFGLEVIRIGPLADLGRAMRPKPRPTSSADGGSSCGSSSGSSSCGGGGGGGGCGGCGGGD